MNVGWKPSYDSSSLKDSLSTFDLTEMHSSQLCSYTHSTRPPKDSVRASFELVVQSPMDKIQASSKALNKRAREIGTFRCGGDSTEGRVVWFRVPIDTVVSDQYFSAA